MTDAAREISESVTTRTPEVKPGVRIFRKHHVLVRLSHWLNVPILLGLFLSGIAIYWASPIYQHKPDPQTGNFDYFADVGSWLCAHVPGLRGYSNPQDWVYNHLSLGPGLLAAALRLHWFCAYLFMLNGVLYLAGLGLGGGWRALLPRRTDLRDAFRMFRYYLTVPFALLMRRVASLHAGIRNITHCNVSHTFRSWPSESSRWLRGGRFTSPCNSICWPRFSAGMTRHASGISV